MKSTHHMNTTEDSEVRTRGATMNSVVVLGIVMLMQSMYAIADVSSRSGVIGLSVSNEFNGPVIKLNYKALWPDPTGALVVPVPPVVEAFAHLYECSTPEVLNTGVEDLIEIITVTGEVAYKPTGEVIFETLCLPPQNAITVVNDNNVVVIRFGPGIADTVVVGPVPENPNPITPVPENPDTITPFPENPDTITPFPEEDE